MFLVLTAPAGPYKTPQHKVQVAESEAGKRVMCAPEAVPTNQSQKIDGKGGADAGERGEKGRNVGLDSHVKKVTRSSRDHQSAYIDNISLQGTSGPGAHQA